MASCARVSKTLTVTYEVPSGSRLQAAAERPQSELYEGAFRAEKISVQSFTCEPPMETSVLM